MYVCIYVFIYVCMYACMYVCMYLCIYYLYIYIYIYISTETALLNIIDFTSTLNTKHCCQLVMLDISSAFDTLDHQIILSRLHPLGVRDRALS